MVGLDQRVNLKKTYTPEKNQSATHESNNDKNDGNENDYIPIDTKKTLNNVLTKNKLMTKREKRKP